MVAAKGWRRVADRLPLTGVAVTGAVVGHTLAYAVAVPQPGARLVLLATTGHTYWSTAIAVAVVCGLASVASSLIRQFRAGLLAARRPGSGRWDAWPVAWPWSRLGSMWSRRPWSGSRSGRRRDRYCRGG